MTATTTVTAYRTREDTAWSEDTSGAVSTHGDLIRDRARQLDWQREQASITKNPENQQVTEVDRARITFASLFPREPHVRPREATFTPLQEWEGYVVDVGQETFTARLIDLTANGEQEEEEADFPIAELSDSDQHMLRRGAIFRWAIGYRRTRGGTKERISRIVFRRLPAWTQRELEENRRKAEVLVAALQGE
jgi:hypothetical protein